MKLKIMRRATIKDICLGVIVYTAWLALMCDMWKVATH